MNGRKAKLRRKENPFGRPGILNEPKMTKLGGVETYIPRRQRRELLRRLEKAIATGKIDLQELLRRKKELDGREREEQRQDV